MRKNGCLPSPILNISNFPIFFYSSSSFSSLPPTQEHLSLHYPQKKITLPPCRITFKQRGSLCFPYLFFFHFFRFFFSFSFFFSFFFLLLLLSFFFLDKVLLYLKMYRFYLIYVTPYEWSGCTPSFDTSSKLQNQFEFRDVFFCSII